MTDLANVKAVLDTYRAAVQAKDVEAFVAVYDHDIVAFDMWGEWSHRGIDAWRQMAADWFGSLGNDQVEVTFDDIQATVGVGAAGMHALVTFTGISAGGERLRAMNNRLSWTLRKKRGTWKVVHEHTSAPIDPATSKVILQRI